MCGGRAKSPRTKTDKMSAEDIDKANKSIDKWKDMVEDENNVIKGQIQERLTDVGVQDREKSAELVREQRLQKRLAAQQIKGSYRVTNGGGSFAGAKFAKTKRTAAMAKPPLQIVSGSLLT